ncbi:hypothetical protein BRC92_00335 [Halobacteriales archaeon QS_4_69_31]|nr:MAG: hypothetical protein BRC92_00335 [Halobacteriales archaeon QS_4_69_31]
MSRHLPLPESWIRPIRELVSLYNEYGSVPRAIAGIITTWIVASVLNLGSYVVGSILGVWDLVASSITTARVSVGSSLGGFGLEALQVLALVQNWIATAVAALGPAGPPVAVAIGSVALFLGYRLVIALIGEFPIGSTIVDVLGLR